MTHYLGHTWIRYLYHANLHYVLFMREHWTACNLEPGLAYFIYTVSIISVHQSEIAIIYLPFSFIGRRIMIYILFPKGQWPQFPRTDGNWRDIIDITFYCNKWNTLLLWWWLLLHSQDAPWDAEIPCGYTRAREWMSVSLTLNSVRLWTIKVDAAVCVCVAEIKRIGVSHI